MERQLTPEDKDILYLLLENGWLPQRLSPNPVFPEIPGRDWVHSSGCTAYVEEAVPYKYLIEILYRRLLDHMKIKVPKLARSKSNPLDVDLWSLAGDLAKEMYGDAMCTPDCPHCKAELAGCPCIRCQTIPGGCGGSKDPKPDGCAMCEKYRTQEGHIMYSHKCPETKKAV